MDKLIEAEERTKKRGKSMNARNAEFEIHRRRLTMTRDRAFRRLNRLDVSRVTDRLIGYMHVLHPGMWEQMPDLGSGGTAFCFPL